MSLVNVTFWSVLIGARVHDVGSCDIQEDCAVTCNPWYWYCIWYYQVQDLVFCHTATHTAKLFCYNILRAVISANTSVDETLITCPCLEDKLSTLEKTEYQSVTKEIFENIIPLQHSHNLQPYNKLDNKRVIKLRRGTCMRVQGQKVSYYSTTWPLYTVIACHLTRCHNKLWHVTGLLWEILIR